MQSIISPPFVICSLYIYIYILSFFNKDFYDYSKNYDIYMLTSLSIFSFSYLIGKILIKKPINMLNRNYINDKLIKNIYHIACILGLVCGIVNYYILIGDNFLSWDAPHLFRRAVGVDLRPLPLGFIILFNPFFFTIIPMILIHYNQIKIIEIIIFLLYLTVFIIISASRSSIFVVFILSFFCYCKLNKNFFNKNFIINTLISVILLYFLFEIFGIVLGKDSKDGMNISFYIIGPTHALDKIINGLELEKFNDLFLSFRHIHSILLYLGFIKQKAQLLPYFNNLNVSGKSINVYTMFGVYIIDYGIYGSLFIISLIAFLSGILKKLSKLSPQNTYLLFLCSLNLTCIVLGCFYDYYMSAGFVWISILLTYFLFPKNYNKSLNIKCITDKNNKM